jgi:ribose transport system substrate-binding protein
MKRNNWVGIGVLASSTILGACGGGDSSTPTTTDTSVTTGTSTTTKSCTTLPPLAKKDKYRVGFSQLWEAAPLWRKANTDSIVGEAAKRGWDLVYTPGTSDDAAEQVSRIQALIDAKVDVIIVAPHDETTISPMVVKARKACIPVFVEDRGVDKTVAVPGVDYVSFIGSDFETEGVLIAEWLIKKTGGTAKIIEFEGTTGSSAAVLRKKGFDETIAKQPGMKILASQSADFDPITGYNVAKTLLPANPTADWVYAHNDGMAFGIIKYLEEIGKKPGTDMKIISIDGTKEGAQDLVDGKIEAITECNPKFGPLLFDSIVKYGNGETLPVSMMNKDRTFDITNAAEYLPEAF